MRFGIREICDVVFKAKSKTIIGGETYEAGQPVLYIDTAKTSTIEGSSSSVYATGGKGNPKLIAWESERSVTFTVEDALFSPVSLSVLTGAGILNASSEKPIVVHHTADVIIGASGAVKLTADDLGLGENEQMSIVVEDDKPVFGMVLDAAGSGMLSCKGEVQGASGKEVVVKKGSDATINFTAASKFAGKTIRVDFYSKEVGHAARLTIDAKNFPGYFYVEGSTVWREQSTGKDFPAEITFPKVKVQSNFTFDMAATGDPSTAKFTMDAMPDYTVNDKQHKVFVAIDVVGGKIAEEVQGK